ncbi:helix-turn-helix transcriptional regulator [Nocardia sp. NBC_00565]|uniref:winged helix-turn-helix transcriptional regulator n=1 Tax=Nocardia sp. NBC_00565 TaxID=2975993 RepID=UPI002E81E7C8|nr:helix-turn-helix domain-containing protein [Nocardia sp. NBC_00565]WUC02338.1 helix-turn-helix transcriptional regulator [Nocardia sp. NBC_00565]
MAVRSQVRHDDWPSMSDAFNSDCPAREVLDHITSRWGILILTALGAGPLRFSELHAMIGGISEKMLSQTLRTLVRDGLIARTVEPTTPPRVSYELTALGRGLTESLHQFLGWIRQNTVEVVAAQRRYDRQNR